MASRLEGSVLSELVGGRERGLWFVRFDPSGGPRPPSDESSSGNGGGRSRSSPRLRVEVIGPPDPGHPSVARRGPVEVVFAGRLFNRRDLAGGKEPRSSTSNASVLLQAYRARGERALLDARGAFAAIVSDREGDLFLAARDPVGTSPLFVAELPDGLVLSTSPDGVLQDPSVPRDLNRPYIVDQLRHAYPDPTETFYSAVRRIMPGHLLRRQR